MGARDGPNYPFVHPKYSIAVVHHIRMNHPSARNSASITVYSML
jgi:hypothetical protein